MRRYDPLTHRSRHELRELDDDPFDWIEGPQHADPWHRNDNHVLLVLVLLTVGAVALISVAVWIIFQP